MAIRSTPPELSITHRPRIPAGLQYDHSHKNTAKSAVHASAKVTQYAHVLGNLFGFLRPMGYLCGIPPQLLHAGLLIAPWHCPSA